MNTILETPRLYLRQLMPADFANLCRSLQDRETMYAYEHAFSGEEVLTWLSKQLASYQKYGFGLWAVIRKEDNMFLGQCGITMQNLHDSLVPEIGYVFQKEFWGRGYALESARACKEYAFSVLGFAAVYSIIRENNFPSLRLAQKNGMTKTGSIVKYYYGMNMPHDVYSVSVSDSKKPQPVHRSFVLNNIF